MRASAERSGALRRRRARRGAPSGLLAAGARHRRPAAAAAAHERAPPRSTTLPASSPLASSDWSKFTTRWALPSSREPSTIRRRRVLLLEAVGEVEQRRRRRATSIDDHVHVAAAFTLSVDVGAPARPPAPLLRLLAERARARRAARPPRARARAEANASPEVTASIRRAPEPTEPSVRIANGADLGRRADVGAAAELAREAVDLDDADDVAVLLAEEHHRAELARLVDRRHERRAPGGSRRPSRSRARSTSLALLGVSACRA